MREVDDILARDGETTLEHYGTKGMRWGIRRTKEQLARQKAKSEAPTPVTIKAKPGKPIITKGGRNQETSEDAKTAAIAKQKAQKSGTQALSNKEMQTLVTRMNLEQQYSRLVPKEKGTVEKGAQFGQALLDSPAPKLALAAVKVKYGDTSDPRVKTGIEVAEMLTDAYSGGGKKKKKT